MKNEKSPVESLWSVICSDSSIDIDSNNISILGVIEELAITLQSEMPKTKLKSGTEVSAIQFPLSYVALLKRSDGAKNDLSFESKLVLVDPNGEVVQEGAMSITMVAGKKRLRVRSPFNQLALTVPGEYVVKLQRKLKDQKDYEDMASIPLDIKIEVMPSKK